MNRLALLVPLAIFAAIAAIFAVNLLAPNPRTSSPMTGKPVPAFALPALFPGEEGLSEADFGKGRAVLLNVFASWCTPCRAEHPLLMALKARGVTIFAIDYKDKNEAGRAFLAELGNPFAKTGADTEGRAGIEWGIRGVPETYAIDGEGRIAAHVAGPLDPRIVEDEILPALGLD